MTSYTLNDPTKTWAITANTLAPKTSGTMSIKATSISAPTGKTLSVTADTVDTTNVYANIILPSGINGTLNISATTIDAPAGQALNVVASTIEPPTDTTLGVTASGTGGLSFTANGTGEITFNNNYIKVNGTKIYFQSTDPGAVGAGSIWFDLP